MASLTGASIGDPVRFELVAGELALGKIKQFRRAGGEVIYVSGELDQPESGRFFFQKQTRRGVAGAFVGVVEFPVSQTALRIEPTGPGGSSELVERRLAEVVCFELPRPGPVAAHAIATVRPPPSVNHSGGSVPTYQNGIIALESLRAATAVVYLDFQGGYTASWGGVTYAKPEITNDEIQEVFDRVAEDFLPFNINVTTDLEVYQHAPEGSRQRVIITPTSFAAMDISGVAFAGSFNWTGDNPCWSFNVSGKWCAETCSHEIGHTLGLSHQGKDVNSTHTEYYSGQGSGETGWAPIMGLSFSQNVSQWAKGEYAEANNQQDALAIITSLNNDVAYCADDTGESLGTSRYLEVYSNYQAAATGVIERTGDSDAFQFTTSGGSVSLRADPAVAGPNLALQVSLYDAQDALLCKTNPPDTLWASLSTNLPAGTYTFRVTGAGRNDPQTNGFSSYASLGFYSITGSVVNARVPDRFTIPEHSPNGTVVGVLPVANPNLHPLAFSISSGGPGSNSLGLDNSGRLSVVRSDVLDYQNLGHTSRFVVQIELFITVTDLADGSLNESNRRVVIAVTPVEAAPIIVEQPTDLMVPAGTNALLAISAYGTAPLDYQWFFEGQPKLGAVDRLLPITNVQPVNSGTYFVTISNIVGAVTSVVAKLSVLAAPPFITSQPVSQTGIVDSNTMFSVAATGLDPLSFQWQFNGNDLLFATNPILILTNLSFDNAGEYRALVQSIAGTSTSAAAHLTCVGLPPTVLRQPANTEVYYDTSARLDLSANGTSPIFYQWRRNGMDIAGATNAQLRLNRVKEAEAGEYSAVISNAFGMLSGAKAKVTFTQVVAWGDFNVPTNVPPGLSGIVRVAFGQFHRLALKKDGTVTAWAANYIGGNNFGQAVVPDGLSNVVDVAAGGYHSLALRADGTVVAWGAGNTNGSGSYNYGQSRVPTGLRNVVAIVAGYYHSAALKHDGQAVVWGGLSSSITNVPAWATDLITISSSTAQSINPYFIGLDSNDSFVAWGNQFPAVSNLIAVAAGLTHYLGLKADRTVFSSEGPIVSGPTEVTALSVLRRGGLALKVDGTVVAWPTNIFGVATVPQGLTNIIGIASDGGAPGLAMALLGDGSAQITVQPTDRAANRGGQTRFSVIAAGQAPLSYQWQLQGKNLIDATNTWLTLKRIQAADAGGYCVIVRNAFGATCSRVARLKVMLPLSESLDAPDLVWVSNGGANWFGQSETTRDGIDAAQTGIIGDNQRTSVQTVVRGPGTVSFWWKVSSEEWFDYLTFSVDGVKLASISGEVDWQQQIFSVTNGTHLLNWTYSKDGADSGGLDSAWLDQVQFGSGPPIITQQPSGQIVSTGSDIHLSVLALGEPPLNYQWLKDGTNLFGMTSSLLSVHNATRRDSGVYAVLVSNSTGTDSSSNALVRVRVPERLSDPRWLGGGQVAIVATDSDGASLISADATAFTAQVSTNLLDWESVSQALIITNGAILLIDPQATNYATRFYRIFEP